MQFLPKETKRRIFTMAIRYSRLSISRDKPMLELVGLVLGKAVYWTQGERLQPNQSLVGGTKEGILIMTAPLSTAPVLVAFAYAHEMAHLLLDHCVEGAYVYGHYTTREAEADAFAYAHLMAGGCIELLQAGTFEINFISRAIQKRNAETNGFSFDLAKQLRDTTMILSIIDEENGIDAAIASP